MRSKRNTSKQGLRSSLPLPLDAAKSSTLGLRRTVESSCWIHTISSIVRPDWPLSARAFPPPFEHTHTSGRILRSYRVDLPRISEPRRVNFSYSRLKLPSIFVIGMHNYVFNHASGSCASDRTHALVTLYSVSRAMIKQTDPCEDPHTEHDVRQRYVRCPSKQMGDWRPEGDAFLWSLLYNFLPTLEHFDQLSWEETRFVVKLVSSCQDRYRDNSGANANLSGDIRGSGCSPGITLSRAQSVFLWRRGHKCYTLTKCFSLHAS